MQSDISMKQYLKTNIPESNIIWQGYDIDINISMFFLHDHH